MRCGNCQHLNPDLAVACSRCGAFLRPAGAHPVAAGAPPPAVGTAASYAPGETLVDRYLVESVLGEGGMATVYQVRDLALDRRAALKVLSPALLANAKAHERMRREANALARVSHPNVVQIFDVLDIGGALAIELELVTGGTLASRIATRPFAVDEAVVLFERLLEGLAVIHGAGLIHRDLKPGNVLLTSDGTPKIADLGIARDPDAQLLTAPGTLLGTPDYMSPEQVRMVEVGPESDLYSMGLVLYEMLTGRLPFDARTEREVLAAHLNQAPNLAALPAGVPESVRRAIAVALEKLPERRFPTAAALREALRAAPGGPAVGGVVGERSVSGLGSEPGRIGEYLVQRLIGEGGMGRVYAAEERLSRRRVALKVLRSEIAASEAGRRLFLNEMAVLAQLDHPNVVRSLACVEAEGQLVMALELLDGQTLRERLNSGGALRWEVAVDIVVQIASALDCAHSLPQPIVHRDLKPENVMLLPDGTVKVMDFGIAKVLEAVQRTATLSIGTLQYMSPEQIDARAVDGRSDLYALGLVFYELVTGRPPFESASQRELLNRQCTEPPPPLPAFARSLPRGVERILFQLLEKAPEARPQTAREVRVLLEPFASADPTSRASQTYGDLGAGAARGGAALGGVALGGAGSSGGVALGGAGSSGGVALGAFGGGGGDGALGVAPSPGAPVVASITPLGPPPVPRPPSPGLRVHPAVAVAIIVLLSLFAGGATLLVRLAVGFVDPAAERP